MYSIRKVCQHICEAHPMVIWKHQQSVRSLLHVAVCDTIYAVVGKMTQILMSIAHQSTTTITHPYVVCVTKAESHTRHGLEST